MDWGTSGSQRTCTPVSAPGARLLARPGLSTRPLTHSSAICRRAELQGSSRLFLDTADVAEYSNHLPLGIFHGVTSNPTLLELAGVRAPSHFPYSRSRPERTVSHDTAPQSCHTRRTRTFSFGRLSALSRHWVSSRRQPFRSARASSCVKHGARAWVIWSNVDVSLLLSTRGL
jgi:hypothetical protein